MEAHHNPFAPFREGAPLAGLRDAYSTNSRITSVHIFPGMS